jgi:hypothetical protein
MRLHLLKNLILLLLAVSILFSELLFKHVHVKSNTSVINIPEQPEEKKKHKYVILAGPHKTASTSVQRNLYSWSESGLLGDDWAWMHPNLTCLREISPIYCPKVQNMLHHKDWSCKAWACLSRCLYDLLPSNKCAYVKSCYKEGLLSQQKTNHHTRFVLGAESIATHLVNLTIQGKETSMFIQGFIDTLPSSATKDAITFVITYRSPRIDHLRSWWKESAYQRKQTLSFRSFLSGEFITSVLDPLYAAQELATRHGFNVIIIDMSGIQAKGWDISSVVACQILGNVPCHLDNMTLLHGSNVSAPSVSNVRKNTMEELNNLTLGEISKIAYALQKLDCNSVHAIFNHPRIQILYPYHLNHTLYYCFQKLPLYSHEQFKIDIQSIVA